MENLSIALFLSMISALAFIAYKHPDAYKKLYWWLLGFILIVQLLVYIYLAGYTNGHLDSYIAISKTTKESLKMPLNKSSYIYHYWYVPLVLCFYLVVLSALPVIGLTEKKEKEVKE